MQQQLKSICVNNFQIGEKSMAAPNIQVETGSRNKPLKFIARNVSKLCLFEGEHKEKPVLKPQLSRPV